MSQTYNIVLLTRISSILDVPAGHVEMLNEKLPMEAFALKNVHVVNNLQDAYFGDKNRVIVCCGGADMPAGSLSREVFLSDRFQKNPKNKVLFCERSFVPRSLGSEMLFRPVEDQKKSVDFEDVAWVDLQGEELKEWEMVHRGGQEMEEEGEEEGEDEEEEEQQQQLETGGVMKPEMSRQVSTSSHTKKKAFMFSLSDTMASMTWDLYGQVIDEDALMDEEALGKREDDLKKQKATETKTKVETREEEEEEDTDMVLPRKIEVSHQHMDVYNAVAFVDFEGRADMESLLHLITSLNPKKLLCVGAGVQETQELVSRVEESAKVTATVLAPSTGETLDVGSDSSMLKVHLREDTLKGLGEPRVLPGGVTVQRMRGMYQYDQEEEEVEEDHKRARLALVPFVPLGEGELVVCLCVHFTFYYYISSIITSLILLHLLCYYISYIIASLILLHLFYYYISSIITSLLLLHLLYYYISYIITSLILLHLLYYYISYIITSLILLLHFYFYSSLT